jgi:SNF2 family DNA or RNA helicase
VTLDYEFRTAPFPYQLKIFEESVEKEYVSLFNDPGTGKSKIIIDQASYLYQQGKIDALLIIAPNGVHVNWVSEEIPKHMPIRTLEEVKSLIYHSSKAKSKTAVKEREKLLQHSGFCVLVLAYEAATTDTFKLFAKRFFAKKRTFMVLDESHRIKKRDGKRKATIVAMGGHAKYRRILTGTPVEIPPDIYAPLRFLSPEFWKSKKLPTTAEFDAMFCVQVDRQFHGKPKFKQTVGYKNLDILQKYVAETGYRVTMEDAGIHLPPVTYLKRYYEMFPEQRRMYDELRATYRTEFEDGLEIDVEAAIVRLLRLQQIICGYCGTGPGEPIKRISEKENPRLDLALEILEDLPHAVILWCRFMEDCRQLHEALGKQSRRYDGTISNEDREIAKKAFQSGDIKYLIMTDAGAEGLTLVSAKSAVFYSNTFSMTRRIQKEARNVRIGQTANTSVFDLVCQGTVDDDIINALRDKFDIASQLTGDRLKSWI